MVRVLFLIAFVSLSFSFTPAESNVVDPVIKLENNIVISPNPASSVTKVFSKKIGVRIERVEVYSMLNQKVISVKKDYSVSSVEINVFNLRNGKYFVKVFLSDGSEQIATLIKIS